MENVQGGDNYRQRSTDGGESRVAEQGTQSESASGISSSAHVSRRNSKKALPQLKKKKKRKRTRSLSPRRGGTDLSQPLKLIPDDGVAFPVEEGRDSFSSLLLENLSSTETFAFRVKTTAPDRYLVRPTMGLVGPKKTIMFRFVIRSDKALAIVLARERALEESRPLPASDKFLILTARVEEMDLSTHEDQKELMTLWSTSRWKKKTSHMKLLATHHRAAVISSDSDSAKCSSGGDATEKSRDECDTHQDGIEDGHGSGVEDASSSVAVNGAGMHDKVLHVSSGDKAFESQRPHEWKRKAMDSPLLPSNVPVSELVRKKSDDGYEGDGDGSDGDVDGEADGEPFCISKSLVE